ncbi:MAG: Glu-tRNA(Gln) amidotransferase subunit GatE [Candidatus Aenigmarchaeota archaeon]|nr:Glu-tRNA(Gln) amidotransferase subunit GatE [Candidatus Aenigmarchaeota archaeon]
MIKNNKKPANGNYKKPEDEDNNCKKPLDKDENYYKKTGLKVGIEIHQRLATKTKLFCSCSAEIDENKKPISKFMRKMRPTTSESGEIDKAALEEFERGKEFIYLTYDNCCSIETDSDFPKEVNKEALKISLQLAKMLNLQVPDELQIMRKVVIDGSNTSGYQRTIFVALGTENSFIETESGRVHIQEIELEEESATKVKEDGNKIYYRLDRLGVPLIELTTEPDIWNPKQAKETAMKIGMLLRSLPVQRGIGTIRQDVNISIKGGARVEIKGFQELKILDKLVENEVKRQADLIKIRDLLKNSRIGFKEKEVTDLFKSSECKILKNLSKEKIVGLAVDNLSGMFKNQCGELGLGKEIANYAKFYGIKGMIHSDEELEKYNISKEELEKLKKELNIGNNDLFLLIGGEKCDDALWLIKRRVLFLKEGVPEETRFAEGAITRYARKLPGKARMYPETDLPKIKIADINVDIPETLEEKAKKFRTLGLNKEFSEQIAKGKSLGLFEELLKYKVEPGIIADLILNTKKSLERRGTKIEKEDLEFVLEQLEKGKITKKALEDVLLNKSIKGFEKIGGNDLEKIATEFKGKYKDKAMQEIMKKYGKRVDSQKVMDLLR